MSKSPILREAEDGPRLIHAVGGLHMIKGNKKPYFSLCIESWEGRREDVFGAAHGELVERWPELKPLADLHLSDIDGVPTYAEDNGWYWLAGAVEGGFQQAYHGGNGNPARSKDECERILARYVRVSVNEARGLVVAMVAIAAEQGNKAARKAFGEWIEAQKPRWKAEADKCIADLGLVVYGDNYVAQ